MPFLKVDKGLADEADGVQVMKPMPGLDALLARAVAKGVFGTKMRSVIKLADAGRRRGGRRPAVRGRPRRSSAPAWCRSSSPRSTSTAPRRPRPRSCCKAAILEQLDALGRRPAGDAQADAARAPTTSTPSWSTHPSVLRVVALSGGYTRDEANAPPGAQPRRDRQLLAGADRGARPPSRATRSSTRRSTRRSRASTRRRSPDRPQRASCSVPAGRPGR